MMKLTIDFVQEAIDHTARIVAAGGGRRPVNHWNPRRNAVCTCGWVGKGTLSEVNALAEWHVADGCEGCDHAIYIETSVLDSVDAR
jgi:hypothetical protein